MTVLEDVLVPNLRLVICGTAASAKSAERKEYYAGRGNKFWATLHEIGLTPRRLTPAEFRELLRRGVGLTDIVKDQAGADSEIDFARAGIDALHNKVLELTPNVLCFNGKTAAKKFLRRRRVAYGLEPGAIGPTKLFVAPSTSARAIKYWDITWWRELAGLVEPK